MMYYELEKKKKIIRKEIELCKDKLL